MTNSHLDGGFPADGDFGFGIFFFAIAARLAEDYPFFVGHLYHRKIIAAIASTTVTGIQSGESTQSQDHAMYPVSFRPIKRMASILAKDVASVVVDFMVVF
jgi:hypothetical protein